MHVVLQRPWNTLLWDILSLKTKVFYKNYGNTTVHVVWWIYFKQFFFYLFILQHTALVLKITTVARFRGYCQKNANFTELSPNSFMHRL